LVNNKPLVSLIHKHRNGWLIKSCEHFGIDYESLPENVLDVTPNLLHTKITQKLIQDHDVASLIFGGCNEFWLYFCYIIKHNDFDALYHVDINSQLSTSGVWVQDHIISSIKDTIDNQFKSEKTIFTLFQSNMHIDRNIYLPIINENINAI
jgi:hypothetical protein